MNAWIILVRFADGSVNVSQDAYYDYQQAVKEINSKISYKNIRCVNNYFIIDTENNISYEIKAITIKKEPQ